MLLADAAAVAIPLLCVSHSQLLFAVLLALITYIQMEHQLNPIYVVFALAGLIVLYILLTIARSHDTAYLNTVFEMKRHLPIFVTQPYIYIANNYDNFDCLVKGLVKHSWGMKMLAPFWTLTGLKFLVPSLTAFPYYVTKEELTTLTMFYDAYYDFGIIGSVHLFCHIRSGGVSADADDAPGAESDYLSSVRTVCTLHALIVFHNLVQQSVHMVLFRGDSGCDISGIA